MSYPQAVVSSDLRVYVWDFRINEDAKSKTIYWGIAKKLTQEFEEKLIQAKCIEVIERRNRDLIGSHRKLEKSIRGANDLSVKEKTLFQEANSNAVVFGEVSDDVRSGEIKVSVIIETFKGEKVAFQSIRLSRGKIFDAESREKRMHMLARKLCTSFGFTKREKPKKPQYDVLYSTNEIYNQDFIFSSIPWKFDIDEKGEDATRYQPISGGGVVPMVKFTSNYPTIAANRIQIRFHLFNQGDEPLYFENLFVEIIHNYKIDKKHVFWNSWMPEFPEYNCKTELNGIKNRFKFNCDLKKRVVELNKQPEHFVLKITGDENCFDKIFNFKIISEWHNALGEKIKIQSDKNYYIGFISSNPYN